MSGLRYLRERNVIPLHLSLVIIIDDYVRVIVSSHVENHCVDSRVTIGDVCRCSDFSCHATLLFLLCNLGRMIQTRDLLNRIVSDL